MKSTDKTEIAGTIKAFLAQQQVAVAGASRSRKKFGNIIFNDLIKKGYSALPVNPNTTDIEGHTCYPNLIALPAEVEAVVFVTHPDQTLALLKEAIQTNIRYCWIQQGAGNDEVIGFCKENNLKFVSDRCILMHLEPVKGIHNLHKFVSKVFGVYPN
jgi:uncharacterized protein